MVAESWCSDVSPGVHEMQANGINSRSQLELESSRFYFVKPLSYEKVDVVVAMEISHEKYTRAMPICEGSIVDVFGKIGLIEKKGGQFKEYIE
ncbi:hypothetical protein Tco_0315822 [Tanacetum coccineum]